jgi:DNA phosphorothioation-dependent restriction protein DptG
MEQVTIFIDISNISSNDRNHLLDDIFQLDNVHFIYIRGTPPEDDAEREQFFKRYTRIKCILDNEQRLVVQWAIDTVNEYKTAGDMYVEQGDKDKARNCFEQGITLYKRLSEFLNEKRRVR